MSKVKRSATAFTPRLKLDLPIISRPPKALRGKQAMCALWFMSDYQVTGAEDQLHHWMRLQFSDVLYLIAVVFKWAEQLQGGKLSVTQVFLTVLSWAYYLFMYAIETAC